MNMRPDSEFSVSLAPHYSWDADPLDPTCLRIQTAHVAECSAEGSSSWVFLNSTSEQDVMRSQVDCGAEIFAMLTMPNGAAVSTRDDKRQRVMTNGEDLLKHMYLATRTVTCHFEPSDDGDQHSERVVDEFVESYWVWDECVGTDNVVRVVQTMCGRTNLRMPPFGTVFAELSAETGITDDLKSIVRHFTAAVYDTAMQQRMLGLI